MSSRHPKAAERERRGDEGHPEQEQGADHEEASHAGYVGSYETRQLGARQPIHLIQIPRCNGQRLVTGAAFDEHAAQREQGDEVEEQQWLLILSRNRRCFRCVADRAIDGDRTAFGDGSFGGDEAHGYSLKESTCRFEVGPARSGGRSATACIFVRGRRESIGGNCAVGLMSNLLQSAQLVAKPIERFLRRSSLALDHLARHGLPQHPLDQRATPWPYSSRPSPAGDGNGDPSALLWQAARRKKHELPPIPPDHYRLIQQVHLDTTCR